MSAGQKPRVVDPLAEEPPRLETDVLLPEPAEAVLSNGMKVKVLPLKARQFFKLLRVITRGAAPLLSSLDTSRLTSSPEAFATDLLAITIFAIPEAPDLAFEFVESMVEIPRDDRGAVTPEGVEIMNLLKDPEIEDVVAVVEVVIQNAKEDLAGLGKRLQSLMGTAKKTGQLTPSSVPSSEPST